MTSTQRVRELWPGGKARVVDTVINWAQRHGCVWFRLWYCSNSTTADGHVVGWMEDLNLAIFQGNIGDPTWSAHGLFSNLFDFEPQRMLPQVSMQSLSALVRQEFGPKGGWKLCDSVWYFGRFPGSFVFNIMVKKHAIFVHFEQQGASNQTQFPVILIGYTPEIRHLRRIPQTSPDHGSRVRILSDFYVVCWNPSGSWMVNKCIKCLVEVKN